ncbi:MAG: Zn-dependent hydrolase [Bacteroidota bacterium]
MKNFFFLLLLSVTFIGACIAPSDDAARESKANSISIEDRLAKYTPFRLEADLSHLSDPQKQMLAKLIEAAEIMDELFWYEAYGANWKRFLRKLPNQAYRQFAQINYGPYDRLDGNRPFVSGVDPKPAGANFYPPDMSKEEFEDADLAKKTDLYTLIRRNEAGELTTLPYYEAFAEQVSQASKLLLEVAELSENASFKRYLTLRAAALINDGYQPSDLAWMDVEDNALDVVIGPIETYEDQLFGYKAAHEAYVLIKDQAWSQRLAKYAQFLPELQENLPADDRYKQEKPGTDADLNAYDVVYYAGDCNAGSKTIAINLPNDEEVQLQKGTRRLQLKNAMRAKFDKILLPISEQLIDESQRSYLTFDAFFANTMFHEVAHGLGIKNVVGRSMTVREALKENASAIEEGKADILGLYMIQQLHEKGEVEGELMNYYVTFMASIFRSVRFGASSAHGKANMIRFNFFQEVGAFVKDEAKGTYRIDLPKFEAAVKSLSRQILTLQGEGDYAGAQALVQEKAVIQADLQADLDRLAEAGIPVDIIFEQGLSVLDLE